MEKRNLTVTLDKAREWYNSGNGSLREIALQVFSENELKFDFKSITSFEKACEVLDINYDDIDSVIGDIIIFSGIKFSASMFKLNIIRKALNLGQDLHLTKDPKDSYIYIPFNPFETEISTYYRNELSSGKMKIIGKIKHEGVLYNVLGGSATVGGTAGVGCFTSGYGVGVAHADCGFLGCASEEIAKHFGEHFGMLITEAKYGDLEDFEIVYTC